MTASNVLTLIRIILAPFLLLTIFSKLNWLSVILYLLCLVTDKLDGSIARKTKTTSAFGRSMDSVADKILVFTAMLGLHNGTIISSLLIFAFIYREFIMLGIRGIRVRNQTAPAQINDFLGRLRFSILHLGIFVLLLPSFLLQNVIGIALITVAIVMSYGVLIFHVVKSFALIEHSMKPDSV